MTARAKILDRIRGGLENAETPDRLDRAGIERRIAAHPRGIQPARIDRSGGALLDLFIEQAEKVNASVACIAGVEDLPEEVARYLASENLPAAFRMAPHPDLESAPWDTRPSLDVTTGATQGKDEVGLSKALCAVAETGTCFMASGAESPTTLNFLPETHIVAVKSSEVTGGYEEAWDRLRQKMGKETGEKQAMPRAVNLVTGPSRTGDIEQTIYLGAHGPRRLHIIVIDDQ